MCGIIGQLGGKAESLEGGMSSIAHRGPDDSGMYRDGPVGLGHLRLSIIDISPDGHQPMQSTDGRYTIVFNGEIFNYIELKSEIGERYDFKTKSDTEVLLAAYSVWGEGMLEKLVGQFAFAIWDTKEQKLILARDHFGIKPLFYARSGGMFYFASEIKALLKMGIKAQPDEGVIFDYLAYEIYDHTDRTFFKGIESLPKGSFAVCSLETMYARKYWDLAEAVNAVKVPSNASVVQDAFLEHLSDAVRLQLRSDVPVGINLSSGLDSSVLLSLAREGLQGDLHAFSAGLSDPAFDECRYIQPWVESMQGIVWHQSELRPEEVFPLSEQLLRVQDQPYGGMPTIQYYALYQKTTPHAVTVLLEGQGMDELLAGYGYFAPDKRGAFLAQFQNPAVKCEYLAQDFEKRANPHTSYRLPFTDTLRNAQYADMYYRKLPRPLRFNDHISMAFSKELRVPFLDHRLAAFCVALPEEYKIKNGVHKVLVRETVHDRMPHVMRPKIDFPAFQTEWLRKYHAEEVRTIVHSGSFRSRPFWDADNAAVAVERLLAGSGNNSFFVWQLINLEQWMRAYID